MSSGPIFNDNLCSTTVQYRLSTVVDRPHFLSPEPLNCPLQLFPNLPFFYTRFEDPVTDRVSYMS